MTTWWDIAGRTEPTFGKVANFEMVVEYWNKAASTADGISASFQSIIGGTTDADIQGQTAVALKALVEETKKLVDEVPTLCWSIANVMSNHATKLADLRTEAEAARARAATAWNSRNDADTLARTSSETAKSLLSQIVELEQLPEPPEAQIESLSYQLTAATNRQIAAEGDRATHQGEIDAELLVWDRVRGNEKALNVATAMGLDNVQLGALANPGVIESGVNAIGAVLKGVADGVVEGFKNGFDIKGWIGDLTQLLQAIYDWDLDGVLWAMRDMLDRGMALLSSVGLILIAVVAIVLAPFTGFTSIPAGLAAAVAFQKAATGVTGGLLLATDVALLARGAINPETGEPMTWATVGVDAIGLLFALGGMKAATTGSTATGLAKYGGRRAVLANDHIILSSGYIISSKTTVGGYVVPKVLEEGGQEFTKESASQLRDAAEGDTPTSLYIDEGVMQLMDPNRGLDAPVEPYLVATY